MRGFFVLCLVSLAAGVPQGGFFSGLTGAFNNLFSDGQNGNRRPPPQRRPQFQQQQQQQQFQPQQQQNFQQPQFQQPAAPAFVPQQQQQSFQPQQQQQFNPQPPAPQFSSRPVQQNTFRQPAPVQNTVIRQPAPAAPAPTTTRLTGGTALCPAHAPNHFWTDPRDGVNRGYVVTWDFQNPCSKFKQDEAKAYCQSMNMEPVSLDSPAKQDEFNRLIAAGAQRYFWTGGIVDHKQRTVFWSNGRATPVPFASSAHWSHTGGATPPRAQPDNRAFAEEGVAEVCLGILNNFYADGIKWHDVACHHRKPTICEPRQ